MSARAFTFIRTFNCGKRMTFVASRRRTIHNCSRWYFAMRVIAASAEYYCPKTLLTGFLTGAFLAFQDHLFHLRVPITISQSSRRYFAQPQPHGLRSSQPVYLAPKTWIMHGIRARFRSLVSKSPMTRPVGPIIWNESSRTSVSVVRVRCPCPLSVSVGRVRCQ